MNVLKWFFGQGCTHRFAWPRADSEGRHYQICLACGTAYEYDWSEMRRTRRVHAATAQPGMFSVKRPAQAWSHPSELSVRPN